MNAQLLLGRAIRAARLFFAQANIIEVRTPKAVPAAAMEPYIDAFVLAGQHENRGLKLATSPEMAMKKIFATEVRENAGASGIYEIAAVFRDDPATRHHACEFTMVEWYRCEYSLKDLLGETARLITCLADAIGQSPPIGDLKIFDLRSLFAESGLTSPFDDPRCFADAWQQRHGSLPHHLNELDLAIAAFNLLFDECVLPRLKQEAGLCAVLGYPEILGAMAYAENGTAERAEIFLHGIELANGYREEFRPEIIRERWQTYNEIRLLRGEAAHEIDENLISALPTMRGVAGMALGLERTLAALTPRLMLKDFS